jgi:hypothetical protein
LTPLVKKALMTVRSWWTTLSPAQRALGGSVAAFDLGMRTWALVDLARRPAAEVRGSKTAWIAGLSVVSSGGILPAVYLLRGRRGPS